MCDKKKRGSNETASVIPIFVDEKGAAIYSKDGNNNNELEI